MSNNFNEFSDIVFPAWLRERGFEDESWHNDAAPRAVRALREGLQLTVWVDYDDPNEREIPGSSKFLVVTETEYGEDVVTLGEFEDEASAIACVDAKLNEFK